MLFCPVIFVNNLDKLSERNEICVIFHLSTLTCPKNASIAVLFLTDPNPSSPFMNAWLSFLGLGRSGPAIM
jgi:hypothetical protein